MHTITGEVAQIKPGGRDIAHAESVARHVGAAVERVRQFEVGGVLRLIRSSRMGYEEEEKTRFGGGRG